MNSNALARAALAAALLTSVAAGQTPSSAAPSLRTFTPEELSEDFALLRHSLEEGHSGLYRYVARKDLDRAFDAARAELAAPLDELGFWRVVAPVVAAIEDGHTGLAFSFTTQSLLDTQHALLPLRVRVIDGRLFVLRDYGTSDASLAGAEIVELLGKSAQQILADLTRVVPIDGRIPTCSAHRISEDWTFARLLDQLDGPRAKYSIVCVPAGASGGERRTLELAGVSLADLRMRAQDLHPEDTEARPTAELEFRDAGAIAVLTIRAFAAFADAERKQPMHAFIDQAFASIDEQGSESLILDLRDNGGGEDELGKLLYAHLVDQPFHYYDGLYVNGRDLEIFASSDEPRGLPASEVAKCDDGRWRVLHHPNLGEQQPAAPHFAGSVFALIDGGSFSATAEFASVAHFNHRVKFVGEEVGGAYYGNTSGIEATVTLPHTKLRLLVPLLRYELSVRGFANADRGVPPDERVVPTIADVLAGRDVVLERALELEGGQ